jgi:hypothetical protein
MVLSTSSLTLDFIQVRRYYTRLFIEVNDVVTVRFAENVIHDVRG